MEVEEKNSKDNNQDVNGDSGKEAIQAANEERGKGTNPVANGKGDQDVNGDSGKEAIQAANEERGKGTNPVANGEDNRGNNQNKKEYKKPLINSTTYEKYSVMVIPLILTCIIELLKFLYKAITNTPDANGVALKDAFPVVSIICIIIGIVLFIISFAIILGINYYIKTKKFNDPNEEKNMKDSFLRLKDFGSMRQKEFLTDVPSTGSSESHFDFLIKKHKNCIGLVVTSCYEFFKDSFSGKGNLVNDVSFEVVFMTKSYKDNQITIVASENDKHRVPPSMEQRKTNPCIYDKSETAELYKLYEDNPIDALSIHIVEDCSDPKQFERLYEGQRETIKSIAVLPVLSYNNELLGTLVVCVNKTSFFREKDHRFWHELLEVYSVELGYHFLVLDFCINHYGEYLSEDSKEPF